TADFYHTVGLTIVNISQERAARGAHKSGGKGHYRVNPMERSERVFSPNGSSSE
ncbi:hypothetical protein BgiBS90_012015, partial [Biomphalaria glabrata]